ncbi:unnamed protein product [Amoebophrya sp. A120]|nr:unnamed protein product [Amoebophrya sp. A120]|eukprot:GSA120T00018093001.1
MRFVLKTKAGQENVRLPVRANFKYDASLFTGHSVAEAANLGGSLVHRKKNQRVNGGKSLMGDLGLSFPAGQEYIVVIVGPDFPQWLTGIDSAAVEGNAASPASVTVPTATVSPSPYKEIATEAALNSASEPEFLNFRDALTKIIALGEVGWQQLDGAFENAKELVEMNFTDYEHTVFNATRLERFCQFHPGVCDQLPAVTSPRSRLRRRLQAGETSSGSIAVFPLVSSLEKAFRGTVAVVLKDLNSWDVSAATSLAGLFENATSITNLDMSAWQTGTVKDYSSLFAFTKLANPDTQFWNTGKGQNFSGMVVHSEGANLNTTNWDMKSALDFTKMFSFSKAADPDVSKWDTSKVLTLRSMFESAEVAAPVTFLWNTQMITSMKRFIFNAPRARLDIGPYWKTVGLTNLSYMFEGAYFNPNVTNWDVSEVLDMRFMFYNSTGAAPDVSKWNTSVTQNMRSMFAYTTKANPDVSKWDITAVTNMDFMFQHAEYADSPVKNWNQKFGPALKRMRSLFQGTLRADPNVTGWNLSGVTDLGEMFENSVKANPNVTLWDVGKVKNMTRMFAESHAADPDCTEWDVSSVTTFKEMFFGSRNATLEGATRKWKFRESALAYDRLRKVRQRRVLGSSSRADESDGSSGDVQRRTSAATRGGKNSGEIFTTDTTSSPLQPLDRDQHADKESLAADRNRWIDAETKYRKVNRQNLTSRHSDAAAARIAAAGGEPHVKRGILAWFLHNISVAQNFSHLVYQLQEFNVSKVLAQFHEEDEGGTTGLSRRPRARIRNKLNSVVPAEGEDEEDDGPAEEGKRLLFSPAPARTSTFEEDESDFYYGAEGYGAEVDNFFAEEVMPRVSSGNPTLDRLRERFSPLPAIRRFLGSFANAYYPLDNEVEYGPPGTVPDFVDSFSPAEYDVEFIDMESMFSHSHKANPDTTYWNMQWVRNLKNMFSFSHFANPNVAYWNTRGATDLSHMFESARRANPCSLYWNTLNVRNYSFFLANASCSGNLVDSGNLPLQEPGFRTSMLARMDKRLIDVLVDGKLDARGERVQTYDPGEELFSGIVNITDSMTENMTQCLRINSVNGSFFPYPPDHLGCPEFKAIPFEYLDFYQFPAPIPAAGWMALYLAFLLLFICGKRSFLVYKDWELNASAKVKDLKQGAEDGALAGGRDLPGVDATTSPGVAGGNEEKGTDGAKVEDHRNEQARSISSPKAKNRSTTTSTSPAVRSSPAHRGLPVTPTKSDAGRSSVMSIDSTGFTMGQIGLPPKVPFLETDPTREYITYQIIVPLYRRIRHGEKLNWWKDKEPDEEEKVGTTPADDEKDEKRDKIAEITEPIPGQDEAEGNPDQDVDPNAPPRLDQFFDGRSSTGAAESVATESVFDDRSSVYTSKFDDQTPRSLHSLKYTPRVPPPTLDAILDTHRSYASHASGASRQSRASSQFTDHDTATEDGRSEAGASSTASRNWQRLASYDLGKDHMSELGKRVKKRTLNRGATGTIGDEDADEGADRPSKGRGTKHLGGSTSGEEDEDRGPGGRSRSAKGRLQRAADVTKAARRLRSGGLAQDEEDDEGNKESKRSSKDQYRRSVRKEVKESATQHLMTMIIMRGNETRKRADLRPRSTDLPRPTTPNDAAAAKMLANIRTAHRERTTDAARRMRKY